MKRILSFVTTGLLATTTVHAQEAAAPAAQGLNFMEVFLAAIAIILLFVIWGLGNILIAYAKKAMENIRKSKAEKTASMIVVFLLLSVVSLAQEPAATEPVKTAVNYGGVSATTFYMLIGVIAAEFLVIFFLVFNIRKLTSELFPKTQEAVAAAGVPVVKKESWLIKTWHQLDRKFFTKAAEQEADVLLDHDYDGIKELDNALPPWWKYGFYITIGLAVVYLIRFHVSGNGPNPEQEYAAELKRADEQMKAYMAKAKDLVDENNVQYEEAGVVIGKELYMKSCVACHGTLGEGGVGPNLTDEYWLHGGGMNDIFKTIKYGYPDKGMQSWQQQFSPKQMAQISSFIKTLKGTNPPNGKAPQGEIYKDEAQPATDSTAVKEAKAVALK